MTEFQERKQEIKNLIQSSNLDRATKRLIDLAKDYSNRTAIHNETQIIRANFSGIRKEENQYGRTTDIVKQRNLLMNQMLNLLIELETGEDDYLDLNGSSTQKTKIQNKHSNSKAVQKSQAILVAKGLSKDYGHFSLQPIDITLKAGEITGLVGKNGSGKSTLLGMLARERKPGTGNIEYPNLNTKSWGKVKSYFCYIPQEIELKRQNINIKQELIYWFAAHNIRGAKNSSLVNEVLYRLELEDYANVNPEKLSGGYKLRFELAKVFGLRPELIILDEPLANLDVNAQINFLEDIRNLADSSKFRSSIIISSQHLEEIESIADQIIFLNDGEVLFNDYKAKLGADRNKNIVELEAETRTEELIQLLHQLGPNISVENRGSNFLISFPLAIKVDELIKHLFNAEIKINYFRDISHSTKSIFEKLIIK